ncbi:ArsR/SmtB family transcription factor [Brachybacterium saurashtrense]|uniref:ArsR family transcriptional regulator n=1 Tax=Brachybacterium saurashtrense TaxID=556288 RepID=A0A345YSC4_9MICO|nr:helix-turn-helix domain-containing protein [Brachybacterium saurashtrense]AXK46826.1 ArsR family transcriptional regulator [Brachybacterium saurashtrense]RRR22541.1 ArsR family transcriptional regulator [Brachybacterium saurashtrense]
MDEDPEALRRLDALEQRIAELEGRGTAEPGSGDEETCAPSPPPRDEDPFWALTLLKEQVPTPGAVVFAGSVDVGAGHLEYQWGRPTGHLLDVDWAEHAESVAALGHPLRLAILRRLVDGEHTVAQLVDELDLASTGVAYHHLSALQAGGWVSSPRRGSWAIPPSRVVPLLAIITALEKG